jgi:putative SOS response-associated peptidase YedK
LVFVGLRGHWDGPEGAGIQSCTILTTIPNELLLPVHHRLAVILPPKDDDPWLNSDVQDVEQLQPLLCPYPSEEMTAYPVSTRVNDPANDSPDCVNPLP